MVCCAGWPKGRRRLAVSRCLCASIGRTFVNALRFSRTCGHVFVAAVLALSAFAGVVIVYQSASGAQRSAPARPNDPGKEAWIRLFNGLDLNDWILKFAKHDLGANFNNTVRVEDGLLKIRYDNWTTFDGEFGHVFYKEPFSYVVKVDGTPLDGGYIALQAETAPIDFRKVELLNLEGCTDPGASNYKSYLVKSNPAMCRR
jgi:hypothetical protein